MTEHTPGPWEIDPRAANHVIADKRSICSLGFHDTSLPDGGQAENSANARLIAAAPDLLAALEIARECIAYCRRAHPDAQTGEGIPVEYIIDEAAIIYLTKRHASAICQASDSPLQRA